MQPRFKFYEIVRILVQPPKIQKAVLNREGPISGMTDPDEEGRRGYAVHIDEYGETFSFAEEQLVATGRFGSDQDYFVTRSRTIWFRGTSGRSILLKTDDNVRALLAYRDKARRTGPESLDVKPSPERTAEDARRLQKVDQQLREWGLDS